MRRFGGTGSRRVAIRATWTRAALAAWLLALVMLSPSPPAATDGLQPPCSGKPPLPPYAEITAPPNVRAWSGDDLGPAWDWRPPPCTGWTSRKFTTLVALAARFRHDGDVDGLLERFGAISALTRVRYWSVSKSQWRDLVEEAYAVADGAGKGDDAKPRRDFSAAELRAAREVSFHEDDTGPAGGAMYRLRLLEVEPTRLVLSVENVTVVRVMFLSVFVPGALQSVYFLDLLAPEEGIWGYYSLTRATVSDIGDLMAPHQTASAINRAAAIYRHIAGIPTDQEPPLAP
jgi:hypothetical protein